MARSRVFVVNEPLRFDPDTGRTDKIIDIGPAEEFGELVHLLQPGMLPNESMPNIILTLRGKLADFDDADYLLPCGSPVAIGLAAAFAAAANRGRVRYLTWRRIQRRYAVVDTAMWVDYQLPAAAG